MSFKRSLIVQASNHCPCYCPGCYNYFSKNEISSIDIINFVQQFVDTFHVKKITVSGGDPLMRSDIVELIEMLSELRVDISMDTVGDALISRLTFNQAKRILSKIRYLGLPLDGTDTKTIQMFRHGYTLERCIAVICKAVSYHANICINTVLHTGNRNQVDKIANIINEVNLITKWQIFQYMPIGPGKNLFNNQFSISERAFNEIQEKITKLELRENLKTQCKSLKNRKNSYLLLGCDGTIWYPEQSMSYLWENCDENNNRIILGTIYDKDIFCKIQNMEVI